jgi:predicted DNA-binding ribbon-helix-helix protein
LTGLDQNRHGRTPYRNRQSRQHRDGRRATGAAGRWQLSRLVKRSFSLAGHRTSVALEPEFWSALTRIAAERGRTLAAVVAAADAERTTAQPLASALRVMALRVFYPEATGPAEPAEAPAPAATTESG